jgi:hypothetical protein
VLTCTNISVIIISTGKQGTEDMNMKNEKQYRLVTESGMILTEYSRMMKPENRKE